MEKDIDRIPKNQETDILIRIDDFGGKVGLTIREFVKSERYTGFTKAGTRIPAEQFKNFKAAINSINEKDLLVAAQNALSSNTQAPANEKLETKSKSSKNKFENSDDKVPEEMEI
jgi:hypothetical protein